MIAEANLSVNEVARFLKVSPNAAKAMKAGARIRYRQWCALLALAACKRRGRAVPEFEALPFAGALWVPQGKFTESTIVAGRNGNRLRPVVVFME